MNIENKLLMQEIRKFVGRILTTVENAGLQADCLKIGIVYEDGAISFSCGDKTFEYALFKRAEAEAKLAASQERERAAVEDMRSMHALLMDVGGCCPECGNQIDELLDSACDYCKGTGAGCWVADPANESRCAAFEWRGPQAGEVQDG